MVNPICESQMSTENSKFVPHNNRANEILEVILSFARQEFDRKVTIQGDDHILDGIGSGVNMLGEELQHSTISLKEKEQLLKEIHHRVKNNMQIISSLLSLQSDNTVDQKLTELLRESRNRINSMALVHEMLYKSTNLSKIEIKGYIETLCTSIKQSYILPEYTIDFKFDIEDIHFDIDRMMPIGLILNEVISNSLKHAFPEKRGEIKLSAKQNDEKYCLTISDNGKGFKTGFDFENDSNLGMQLINILADQLGGTIAIESINGVQYQITF